MIDVVAVLIDLGAKVEHTNKYGHTAFTWACCVGHGDIVRESIVGYIFLCVLCLDGFPSVLLRSYSISSGVLEIPDVLLLYSSLITSVVRKHHTNNDTLSHSNNQQTGTDASLPWC